MKMKKFPCDVVCGTFVFASILSVLLGLASLLGLGITSVSLYYNFTKLGDCYTAYFGPYSLFFWIFLTTWVGIAFAFTVLLWTGVYKRNAEYVKIYYMYGVMAAVLYFFSAVGFCILLYGRYYFILYIYYGDDEEFCRISCIIMLCMTVIQASVLVMVRAAYKKILLETITDQCRQQLLASKKEMNKINTDLNKMFGSLGTVENGSFIYGIFHAIASCIVILACFGYIGWEICKIFKYQYSFDPVFFGSMVVAITGAGMSLAFAIILCKGIRQRKAEYVKVYFVYGVVADVLCLSAAVGFSMFYIEGRIRKMYDYSSFYGGYKGGWYNEDIYRMASNVMFCFSIIQSSVLVMVRAAYKKILLETTTNQYSHQLLVPKKEMNKINKDLNKVFGSLRTVENGSFIFGIFHAIASCIAILVCFWYTGWRIYKICSDGYPFVPVFFGLMVVAITCAGMSLAFAIILCKGIRQRKAEYVKVYFVYGVVADVLCLSAAVGFGMSYIDGPIRKMYYYSSYSGGYKGDWYDEDTYRMVSNAMFCFSMFYSFVLYIIRALYKKMESETKITNQYGHQPLVEDKMNSNAISELDNDKNNKYFMTKMIP